MIILEYCSLFVQSTLVNSMFLTNIYTSQPTSLTDRLGQTLQVETHRISLEEQGVRLALTLVDTPGTHTGSA
jgi:septin 7